MLYVLYVIYVYVVLNPCGKRKLDRKENGQCSSSCLSPALNTVSCLTLIYMYEHSVDFLPLCVSVFYHLWW